MLKKGSQNRRKRACKGILLRQISRTGRFTWAKNQYRGGCGIRKTDPEWEQVQLLECWHYLVLETLYLLSFAPLGQVKQNEFLCLTYSRLFGSCHSFILEPPFYLVGTRHTYSLLQEVFHTLFLLSSNCPVLVVTLYSSLPPPLLHWSLITFCAWCLELVISMSSILCYVLSRL